MGQLPDSIDARESRGLARALSGDLAGASEDFALAARRRGDSPRAQQRAEWAQSLQAGQNPFDGATLEELQQASR